MQEGETYKVSNSQSLYETMITATTKIMTAEIMKQNLRTASREAKY